MENENKTKEQLMNELQELRQRIAELEASEAERKKAEEKLKESEEKHRALFEASPDAIAQMDREGEFITANPAMTDRFGISREELIGRRLFDVAPKEIAQRRMEIIRKAMDEGQIQIFEDEREGKYLHNIFVPIKIPGTSPNASRRRRRERNWSKGLTCPSAWLLSARWHQASPTR